MPRSAFELQSRLCFIASFHKRDSYEAETNCKKECKDALENLRVQFTLRVELWQEKLHCSNGNVPTGCTLSKFS